MHSPVPNIDGRTVEADLTRICEQALKAIVISPEVEIQSVTAECVQTARFESFREKLIFIVCVHANDASMVRGDSNLYKGSYKERIEGILDFYAKSMIPNSEVHLEINGPNKRSVERLIEIEDLINSGRISGDSPIVETAHQFSIPQILIRGRHFIAPSPTIAAYLDSLVQRESIKSALDLFGGTGLTAKVLCAGNTLERITVVEQKRAHLERMKKHLQDKRVEFVKGDAFTYQLRPCDLVVADPYYEDSLRFLHARLDAVLNNARVFVFVPGKVEDIRWNDQVEQRLKNTRAKVHKWEKFGQVLFEIRA